MESDPSVVRVLSRALDVIRCFGPDANSMSLSEVAEAAGLPRATARRLLTTLTTLGYARMEDDRFVLAPRVLELGMAYLHSTNLWEIVRPNLVRLVRKTGESSSVAQLDGSDIVYVARVAVPKLVSLSVTIGTRFPAVQTSLGKVLLADLEPDELEHALNTPSRSPVHPRLEPARNEIYQELTAIKERGWSSADEELAPGIRSIAAAIHGASGRVVAAVNVTVQAAETPMIALRKYHLPLLLNTARDISSDWTAWHPPASR